MNSLIDELLTRLRQQLPDLRVSVDAPDDETATCWIDLDLKGHPATVEWRPGSGFGVSSSDHAVFGEGSDEIYPGVEPAFERITALLMERERTRSPEITGLAELRQSLQVTQEELAKRLHVRQAAISRLENRADTRVSTLRDTVEALGGELEVRAKFPDGVYTLAQHGNPAVPNAHAKTAGKRASS